MSKNVVDNSEVSEREEEYNHALAEVTYRLTLREQTESEG